MVLGDNRYCKGIIAHTSGKVLLLNNISYSKHCTLRSKEKVRLSLRCLTTVQDSNDPVIINIVALSLGSDH